MDSNRKFIDFRELLSSETEDGGQIVVTPCGNVRKAETLMDSPKITDQSKILIYVGVNDIDTTLYLLQRSFKRNSSTRYTYQT